MNKTLRLVWVVILTIGLLPVDLSLGQGGGDPVAPPEDANLPIEDVAFEADFSDASVWQSGQSAGDQMSYGLSDSGYSMESVSADGGIGAAPPIDLVTDDYYTEFRFTVDTCQIPESALLFYVRMFPESNDPTSTDSYVLVLQCSGDYRARSVQLGAPGPIDVDGVAGGLEEGSEHVMGILMVGNQIVWFMDGEEIAAFEADPDIRTTGTLTPGAQRGLAYTINEWRVWNVKSTGSSGMLDGGGDEPLSGTDPVTSGELGALIYEPSFEPPTSIELGLHHNVAAYIAGGLLNLYNTQPIGIMPLTDLEANDFYLETSFIIRDCAEDSSFGFVWRASDDFSTYYAYEMQCDGTYMAYLLSDGAVAQVLSEGEITPAPQEFDRSLTVGVYVAGDTVWLYFGNRALTSFSDTTLTDGQAGLLLTSGEDNTRMDILLQSITGSEVR
jgi:hypothetical protein